MKQNLAKTLMIVTGLGVLVGVAVAQTGIGPLPKQTEYREKRAPDYDRDKGAPDYRDKSDREPGGSLLPQVRAGNEALPELPNRDMVTTAHQPDPALGAPEKPGSGRFGPANLVNVVGREGRIAQQAEQVARSIGAAKSDAEKDKLKSQLSEILEKQFDFRQRRHESEIAELEAQVRRLRELVQKRQENRREIIAKRLDVIVRDAEGLGW